MCPECEKGELRQRESSHTETHGLDCGPYERWTERWWQCSHCGEKFDESELRERANT